MLTTVMICVIHENPPPQVFANFFQDQTLSPPSLSNSTISHSPIPDSIISPHLSLTLVTRVLDIGKHTFNYPWPHISLKYLHCTSSQGVPVHDLSPQLIHLPSLRQRMMVSVSAICIHVSVKSWKS